jgi:hypothetical protein
MSTKERRFSELIHEVPEGLVSRRRILHNYVKELYMICRRSKVIVAACITMLKEDCDFSEDDVLYDFVDDVGLNGDRNSKYNTLWDDDKCYWPYLDKGPMCNPTTDKHLLKIKRFVEFVLEFDEWLYE